MAYGRIIGPLLSSLISLRGQRIVACWVLLAAGSGCSPAPPAVSGDDSVLAIGVDAAAAPLAEGLVNAYEGGYPDTTLTLVQAGRQATLDALVAGTIDAALIFMPPKDQSLFATPIAQDIIVFVTHPDNEVDDLDQADIAGLLTGTFSSWRDVGGPDLAVSVIVREPESSTRMAVNDLLVLEQSYIPTARLIADDYALQRLVAQTSGSIGFVAHSYLLPMVRALPIEGSPPTLDSARRHSYPLTVPIVFATPQEPDGNLRQFLDWVLSAEGQQVVQRHMLGFGD